MLFLNMLLTMVLWVAIPAYATIAMNLTYQQPWGWYAGVSIGTPPQALQLMLNSDQISSVPYKGSGVCTQIQNFSCMWGSYDPGASATKAVLTTGGAWDQTTGDFDAYFELSVDGDLFLDTWVFGNTTATNYTFAVIVDGGPSGYPNTSTSGFGSLGMGTTFPNDTSLIQNDTLQVVYQTVASLLASEGRITTAGYSLWGDYLDTLSGSLVLGGIDTSKFTGSLIRFKAFQYLQADDNVTYHGIPLTAVRAVSSTGTDVLPFIDDPVWVTPRTSASQIEVPVGLAEVIYKAVGAEVNPSISDMFPVVPCERRHSSGYLSFEFWGDDGPKINISMKALIVAIQENGEPKWEAFKDGNATTCVLAILGTPEIGGFFFADPFLRDAYVVYDQFNGEMALAQANHGPGAEKSSIVSFASYGARIPLSTPAPSQYAPSKSQANQTSLPPWPNATATFVSTVGFQKMPSPSDSSKVALAVGIAIGFVLLMSAAIFAWVKVLKRSFLCCSRVRTENQEKQIAELEGHHEGPPSPAESSGLSGKPENGSRVELDATSQPVEIQFSADKTNSTASSRSTLTGQVDYQSEQLSLCPVMRRCCELEV